MGNIVFYLNKGLITFGTYNDFSLQPVAECHWNLHMKRQPDASMHPLFCMNAEDFA